MPVIMYFDLCTLQAPPRHLLERYTGASRVLSESFFSLPRNERFYQDSLDRLEEQLQRLSDSPPREDIFLAVLVNCRAGMHRSVAMAERLATDMRSWRWDGFEGVNLVVEHLDTDVRRGVRRAQRARAVVHEQYCVANMRGENRRY